MERERERERGREREREREDKMIRDTTLQHTQLHMYVYMLFNTGIVELGELK